MATEPSGRPRDTMQGRAPWDHPQALGWQVWRRTHDTGPLTTRLQRDLASANSRAFGDRVSLASSIQRRRGGKLGSAGSWSPLDFPLRRMSAPFFDSGHSSESPQPIFSASARIDPSPLSSSPSVQKFVSAAPVLSRLPNAHFAAAPSIQANPTAGTLQRTAEYLYTADREPRSRSVRHAHENPDVSKNRVHSARYPELTNVQRFALAPAQPQFRASTLSSPQMSPPHSQVPRTPGKVTDTVSEGQISNQVSTQPRTDGRRQSQRESAYRMPSTSSLAMQLRREESVARSVPSASQTTGFAGSMFRGQNMPVHHGVVLQRQMGVPPHRFPTGDGGTPVFGGSSSQGSDIVGARESSSANVLRSIKTAQTSHAVSTPPVDHVFATAPLATLSRSILDLPTPLVSPVGKSEPSSTATVQRSLPSTRSRVQEASAVTLPLTRFVTPEVTQSRLSDSPLTEEKSGTVGQSGNDIQAPAVVRSVNIPLSGNIRRMPAVLQTASVAFPLVHRAVTGSLETGQMSEQEIGPAPWHDSYKNTNRVSAEFGARGSVSTSTVVPVSSPLAAVPLMRSPQQPGPGAQSRAGRTIRRNPARDVDTRQLAMPLSSPLAVAPLIRSPQLMRSPQQAGAEVRSKERKTTANSSARDVATRQVVTPRFGVTHIARSIEPQSLVPHHAQEMFAVPPIRRSLQTQSTPRHELPQALDLARDNVSTVSSSRLLRASQTVQAETLQRVARQPGSLPALANWSDQGFAQSNLHPETYRPPVYSGIAQTVQRPTLTQSGVAISRRIGTPVDTATSVSTSRLQLFANSEHVAGGRIASILRKPLAPRPLTQLSHATAMDHGLSIGRTHVEAVDVPAASSLILQKSPLPQSLVQLSRASAVDPERTPSRAQTAAVDLPAGSPLSSMHRTVANGMGNTLSSSLFAGLPLQRFSAPYDHGDAATLPLISNLGSKIASRGASTPGRSETSENTSSTGVITRTVLARPQGLRSHADTPKTNILSRFSNHLPAPLVIARRQDNRAPGSSALLNRLPSSLVNVGQHENPSPGFGALLSRLHLVTGVTPRETTPVVERHMSVPEHNFAQVQRSRDPSFSMLPTTGLAADLPLVHVSRPESAEERMSRTQSNSTASEPQPQLPTSVVATVAQSGESAQKNANETTAAAPHSQIDLDEIVEKAWQKLMLKVTVERERRGGARWL